MKKLGVVIVMSLFLIGFAIAAMEGTSNRLTNEQIHKIVTEKNRIHSAIENGTCPNNCTCEGSVTRCELANGTREMTVVAGKSGNVIIQIQGINVSTNTTLYKGDNGKVYGIFRNNDTRIIKLLPDQVQERIRAKFSRQLENENISLNENGTYDYSGEKNATLFFFFHVKEKINAQLDSQTGEITNVKTPWWAFLAKDESQPIVGASCGTVTPGYNDACCQTKNYDFWNMTAAECQFNSSN
ncbi:Uncharacterised protein [uncultured archaeon]|nr:Uncharacterised protein [uncultured archaeon]